MIPKIIHYCWFGFSPKTKLAQRCIKSWEKKCKDYRIIEWNEDNFELEKAPLYVKQAYDAKKWAFVTDYVRLWALVHYGGVYMDTDVEVIKPLDRFLEHHAFSGFESEISIQTGIMACEKGFPLFIEFLEYYDSANFYNESGEINYTTNVSVITNYCIKHGLLQNNTYQEIKGFALYPKDYFCPIDYSTRILKKTKNTATIHWFAGSWHSTEQRFQAQKYAKQCKKSYRLSRNKDLLDKIIHIPNKLIFSLIGEDNYVKLKKKIKK